MKNKENVISRFQLQNFFMLQINVKILPRKHTWHSANGNLLMIFVCISKFTGTMKQYRLLILIIKITYKYILFNFWSTMYKLVVPKFVCWILYKLNKGDQKAPRMWSIYYQSLQKNPEKYKKVEIMYNMVDDQVQIQHVDSSRSIP